MIQLNHFNSIIFVEGFFRAKHSFFLAVMTSLSFRQGGSLLIYSLLMATSSCHFFCTVYQTLYEALVLATIPCYPCRLLSPFQVLLLK